MIQSNYHKQNFKLYAKFFSYFSFLAYFTGWVKAVQGLMISGIFLQIIDSIVFFLIYFKRIIISDKLESNIMVMFALLAC